MSVTFRGTEPPGILVSKAAQNLPQTATATLFTVNTGTILVQFLYGLVTTALGATATNLSLGVTPSGGVNVPAAISTAAAVQSKVLGSLYVPNFSAGVAAAPVQAGVVALQNPLVPFIVPAGVITWTTSASDTGQMAWYLNYLPIDSGAYVS